MMKHKAVYLTDPLDQTPDLVFTFDIKSELTFALQIYICITCWLHMQILTTIWLIVGYLTISCCHHHRVHQSILSAAEVFQSAGCCPRRQVQPFTAVIHEHENNDTKLTNCKQPKKSIKKLAQTCDWVGCCTVCCLASDLCAEHCGRLEKTASIISGKK